jgi:hypothetical protein
MKTRLNPTRRSGRLLSIPLVLALTACATSGGGAPPVTLVADQPNVVSYWNDIANKTVLAPATVNTTPEERTPTFFFDVASVHVAIYDAVVAVEGRYKPFAVKPRSQASGASVDAAASAAAYGVLKALFPNRHAQYQAAYEQRLAALPDGQAKTLGVALGSEVAAEVVRLRANDGRSVALAPYVSGSAAGQFRSANPTPVFRHFPAIKPFSLNRLDQFRPAPPPALDSASYAAAVNETRSLGGLASSVRTAEQTEVARFHTEPPPMAITRNLGRFASSTANVGDAARLMATLYVSYVDAIGACFEAKYHHATWRPVSAINMADAAWKPVLPTPNHPEYPAAHSCTSGSVGEALKRFYGTPKVTFTWDSKVTNTTRTYADVDAFNAEAGIARIHGGMHFTYSTVAGETLGKQVGQWVASRHFGRQD